ncbi:MAG: double-cubane-cluster-containing anaerobic reductase, partial [Rikenellaceae bacterium]
MRSNRQAWTKLGIDLVTHDAVLNIVGTSFGATYLSQNNRPEKMGYFNKVMSDLHGARILELMDAQEQGRKVIGTFCVFVPEELIIATNAISVGLCAGAELGFEAAEQFVPRGTCALIKSAFGFNLAKVCPFIEVSDLIVGENTCDGKKKSFESYAKIVKNLYVMDLPQMKGESGRTLLNSEYNRFAKQLEELTGVKITEENLSRGIRIVNNKRKALTRLAALRAANPTPISGLDVLLINQIAFLDDPERFTNAVNELCDELDERVKNGEGVCDAKTPRILISGCPMAIPNWKLPNIIEKSNAVIIGEEMCTGERGSRNLTAEDAKTKEAMIDAVTDRYFKIDCAVFTPNNSRLEHIKEMVTKYKADGVIHY